MVRSRERGVASGPGARAISERNLVCQDLGARIETCLCRRVVHHSNINSDHSNEGQHWFADVPVIGPIIRGYAVETGF